MTERAERLAENKTTHPCIDIEISDAILKAGNLLLVVSNESHLSIHEILLIPLPPTDGSISDTASRSMHDGSNPEFLGETALEPGQSLSVRVHLSPGEYALFVNSLGFYTDMIWTSLTVTP